MAKGYLQKKDIDSFESFAPTASHITIRLVLAITAESNTRISSWGWCVPWIALSYWERDRAYRFRQIFSTSLPVYRLSNDMIFHTAYVSIRQHTSAYVSIHQHRKGRRPLNDLILLLFLAISRFLIFPCNAVVRGITKLSHSETEHTHTHTHTRTQWAFLGWDTYECSCLPILSTCHRNGLSTRLDCGHVCW